MNPKTSEAETSPSLVANGANGARLKGPVKHTPARKFVAACIIVAGFCFVAGLYIRNLDNKNTAARDYIEYWSAGQQLIHHANPYDLREILRMERQVGFTDSVPRVSYSPPVAFFMVLPLGFVSPVVGLTGWLIAQLAAVAISLWILWMLNGKPDSRWHLLGFVFAPVIACQEAGQLGNFFLLFLVLFLYLYRRHPFLAGAVLMPFAMKPHLFLPFALALMIWVVMRKAYGIAAGFVVALAASCAVTLYFDPHVWLHYRQMMAVNQVLGTFVPAWSVALRWLIDWKLVWIQFVPVVVGCVWALWYFWTRRDRWVWADHGLLLLLVAAICTPYGWYTDEAMLLPAVLGGLYCAIATGRSVLPLAVIATAALIETFSGVHMNTPYYLWTTPAWLLWYLYATGRMRLPWMKAGSPASAVA